LEVQLYEEACIYFRKVRAASKVAYLCLLKRLHCCS
jgi:hypothetical protein